jgi:hypothetical protein
MLPEISMLPAGRQQVYAYHKLAFDSDGTPLRDDGTTRVFHPILAAYLICDYVLVHAKTRDPKTIELACTVAQRALEHVKPFHAESLVFWYEPETGLSSIPKRFYSGLTQAWYLKAFVALSRFRPEFEIYLAPVFRSLMVSITNGGPLIQKEFGWIVEEHPFEPPLYTLNGWITLLRILIDNKAKLRELDDYTIFMQRNADAVAHLLPLYDAEFCLNSRYQLAGLSRMRLSLPRRAQIEVSAFSVEIPGEGSFPGELEPQPNRWRSFLEKNEPSLAQFNIVQSLISFPQTNKVRITARASATVVATASVAAGEYDPERSAMKPSSWRKVDEVSLEAGRESTFEIDLAWDDRNMFAYPTNFAKLLKGPQGLRFNTYHFIHIVDLATLFSETRMPVFKYYLEKWLSYSRQWRSLSILPQDRYSLQPYTGQEFFDNVQSLVEGVGDGGLMISAASGIRVIGR